MWLTAGSVFVLKSLFLLLTPIRGLASTTWLIDDSLIEMCVSRNIAQGFGFSLDQIHPTTGAPFFWIYLESLNHFFLPFKDWAIRATFIESTLFGTLATVLVFFIALKLTKDRRIAWTAFLLSTFTASAFFNAMNGMDTAIFTFFVLLGLALFLGVGRPNKWSNFAWGGVTGLALGLALMTRGDGIFVLFGLFCVRVYELLTSKGDERRETGKSLLGMLIIAGLCFTFFMGWQLLQTGSPFPGNQVGRRELALAWHGFSFSNFSLPRYLTIVAWMVFQLTDLITIATGGFLLALVAFLTGAFNKDLKKLSIFSAIYFVIFFGLLVGYQWYFADFHGLRYLNSSAHILFIYIAFLFWRIPVDLWKKGVVTLLGLALIILAGYKHYQQGTRMALAKYMSYISQPDPVQNKIMWGTIDWMRDNLPAGTLVGVRDYGRVCLFTSALVQDIAGNIDPAAAAALNEGALDKFLKDRNINYLLIPSLEMRSDKLYQYLHKNLRLEQVKEAPVSPTQILYQIIW